MTARLCVTVKQACQRRCGQLNQTAGCSRPTGSHDSSRASGAAALGRSQVQGSQHASAGRATNNEQSSKPNKPALACGAAALGCRRVQVVSMLQPAFPVHAVAGAAAVLACGGMAPPRWRGVMSRRGAPFVRSSQLLAQSLKTTASRLPHSALQLATHRTTPTRCTWVLRRGRTHSTRPRCPGSFCRPTAPPSRRRTRHLAPRGTHPLTLLPSLRPPPHLPPSYPPLRLPPRLLHLLCLPLLPPLLPHLLLRLLRLLRLLPPRQHSLAPFGDTCGEEAGAACCCVSVPCLVGIRRGNTAGCRRTATQLQQAHTESCHTAAANSALTVRFLYNNAALNAAHRLPAPRTGVRPLRPGWAGAPTPHWQWRWAAAGCKH